MIYTEQYIDYARILENFEDGLEYPIEVGDNFDNSLRLLIQSLQEDDADNNIALELGILSKLNRLNDVICLVLCSKYNYIIPIIQKI